MKYLVMFAFISLAAGNLQDKFSGEQLIDIVTQCKKEAGILIELNELLENKSETENLKCLLSCVLQKFGLMNHNGKIIKDEVIKTILFFFKNNINEELVASVIDKCNALDFSTDLCEAAFKNAKCIKNKLQRNGVSFNRF